MQPLLEAKGVTKYFHDPVTFKVLDNINFSVNKGEFLTVVGKSGCGKSTLLYLLSTMDTNYEGDIFLNGNLLTGLSPSELATFRNENLGFIFQFHFLLPEFTALQNVMIPALKLGKLSDDEIEHKAMEKLKLLGMDTYALNKSSKLSGGQQQRVAIARALINDPAIIMGDEPTGNLDKANTNAVFNILKDLSVSFGQTIISVTHDTDFANNSDRTITMEVGKIISS